MMLSDPLSTIFHEKSDYLIHFPQSKQDPSFMLDLEQKLTQNRDYIRERSAFGNKHYQWSFKRRHDEFFKEYSERFLFNLDKFMGGYRGENSLKIAERFCKEWYEYRERIGVELVERAIQRLR